MSRWIDWICAVLLAVPTAVFVVHAQVPAVPSAIQAAPPIGITQAAPPPAAPKLEELDIAQLLVLNLTEEKAASDCQALPSVKRFNDTAADVLAKIEARHPGFTVDRSKGVLVPKAAK